MSVVGAQSISGYCEMFSRVKVMDDSMHTFDTATSRAPFGWKYDSDSGLSGYGFSTNGDIAVINTGTGSNDDIIRYKKEVYPGLGMGTVHTSSFPLIVARAKNMLSNAEWMVEAYDTDTVSLGYSNWITSTDWVTTAFTMTPGKTLDKFLIHTRTEYGTNTSVSWDYVCCCATIPWSPQPINMHVELGMTDDIGTAEFECDYPMRAYTGDENYINNHVKIWLAKDDADNELHKVFTGKVTRFEKPFVNKDPRVIRFYASDYSTYLNKRKVKRGNRFGRASAPEMLQAMMQPLIDEGILTAATLSADSSSIVKTCTADEVMREFMIEFAEDQKNNGIAYAQTQGGCVHYGLSSCASAIGCNPICRSGGMIQGAPAYSGRTFVYGGTVGIYTAVCAITP